MNKLSKLQLKAKRFAPKYLMNNMNGTKTVMELQPTMKHSVAKNRASEIVANPTYQKEIIRELEETGFDKKERARLLKRNAKQKRSYSASNQAIDIATKIEGDYAPQRRETLNINLTGKELDARIQEKLQELKQLQAQTG